jgi:tRNA (cmo5U34)-methyltransferase
MTSEKTDRLYAAEGRQGARFAFDEQVAEVFPDMIRRSVPGYGVLIEMIGPVVQRHLQPEARCYDLGCSLGAVTLALRRPAQAARVQIIAVDSSFAMLRRLAGTLRRLPDAAHVQPLCADIADVRIERACAVVLNLTLQFVAPEKRLELLRRVRTGLLPGGVLVLTEKVCFDDPLEQATMTGLHEAFKRANGYSELEISRKRSALERVLIPDSVPGHQARLGAAGFGRQTLWFRCLNFVSFLAWP